MVAFTSDSQMGPFGAWLYSMLEKRAWPVLTDSHYNFDVSDWSPDGKWISIRGGEGDELWLLPSDGGTRKQLTYNGERVRDFGATFSPDGSTLAFVSNRAANHNQVWLMDLNNLAVTQLTYDPWSAGSPDWSPDGDRIVYASYRTGNSDLWIIDVPKHPRWIKQIEELDP